MCVGGGRGGEMGEGGGEMGEGGGGEMGEGYLAAFYHVHTFEVVCQN